MDIDNADNWVADVFGLDIDREPYKVEQTEIKKLIAERPDCQWG